jgi:hypothetical protein
MQAVVIVLLLGAGATASWALFMGPIGKAVARWIEARTPQAQGQLMADLAELEGRVTRVERLLREAAAARGLRPGRGRAD